MLLVLNTPDVMEINNAGVSKICRVKIYPALVEFNCENWWRRYRDLLCSEAQAVRYSAVQCSAGRYQVVLSVDRYGDCAGSLPLNEAAFSAQGILR